MNDKSEDERSGVGEVYSQELTESRLCSTCPIPWGGSILPRMSRQGRFCCKTPIIPFDQFPANRPNEPQSSIDVALRPLPKSPVSSSLDNVVPQSIVRSPRVRPGNL